MYNEEAVAEPNLKFILKYAKEIPTDVIVLVVNDGSNDATGSKVKWLVSEYGEDRIHLISHEKNMGYGAALRTGMKYAIDNEYDYALFMDSDLTNHPRYLKDFFSKMQEGYDYIKATRYAMGGGTEGVPFGRWIISRAGNLFAKTVTGLPLTDITNGYRAVRTDILKKVDLTENHFSIIVQEVMQARKVTDKFCEIPNVLRSRTAEAGKSSFKYDLGTFWKYIKYLFE